MEIQFTPKNDKMILFFVCAKQINAKRAHENWFSVTFSLLLELVTCIYNVDLYVRVYDIVYMVGLL